MSGIEVGVCGNSGGHSRHSVFRRNTHVSSHLLFMERNLEKGSMKLWDRLRSVPNGLGH